MFKEMTFIRDADSSSRSEKWLAQAIFQTRNSQSAYRVESDATVSELTLLEEHVNPAIAASLNKMANRISALEARQAFLLSEIRELRFQLDLRAGETETENGEDFDEFYDEAYAEAMELKKVLP